MRFVPDRFRQYDARFNGKEREGLYLYQIDGDGMRKRVYDEDATYPFPEFSRSLQKKNRYRFRDDSYRICKEDEIG